MAGEKTATFGIDLKSNAGEVSAQATAEIEGLRAKIEQSQVALKGMSGALRSLKGSSDEVAKAKEHLKGMIDAEKGAASVATLELLKQGKTYEQLTSSMRKAETAQKKLDAKKQAEEAKKLAESVKLLAERNSKMSEGIRLAGGPVADLSSKFSNLKGVVGGTGGAMGAMVLGGGLLVAAVVAVTAAAAGAAVSLGKFVITGADALRSMGLMREAASGSAENAKNLGTQVDFLSRKVATSKEKINEVGVALVKSLSGGTSRASGQTIVDTFAAVTEASAAMGDEVGNTLKGLVERGKAWNRFSLTPHDMMGTGLQFGDVAAALSKNLGIGLEAARTALHTGRVKLEDGAKALRTAVEAQFGKVNAEKLLSVDVQIDKFHEHLIGLTKGVVLEPLLKGMDKVLSKFDATTVTGQTLERIVTKIGDAIVKWSGDHADGVAKAISGIVLEAEKLYDALDSPMGQAALKGLELAALGVGVAIGVVVGGVALVAAGLGAAALGVKWLIDKFDELDTWVRGSGDTLRSAGKDLIIGLVHGIEDGAAAVWDAMTGIGEKAKNAFKAALGISSPSKVFAEYGKQTSAGYQQGLRGSSAASKLSIENLAPDAPPSRPATAPPASPSLMPSVAPRSGAGARGASSGGSGGDVFVNLTVNLPEGMSHEKAHDVAKAVASPSILHELTKAIRQGMVTQGLPTQAPVMP